VPANVDQAVSDLVLETFRLNGRLLAAGDALVADLGLTSARWQVLGAMALSPVPLSVAQIGRNMGLTRQAVQRLVNEMQDDGLVDLAPNPHHQRAKLVVLSPRGRKAFAGAMKRQTIWANELARGVTIREVAAATATLRRLRQRLERMEPHGMEVENMIPENTELEDMKTGEAKARRTHSATKS
jgi:DNA-binding MarR family transcriptional regulator